WYGSTGEVIGREPAAEQERPGQLKITARYFSPPVVVSSAHTGSQRLRGAILPRGPPATRPDPRHLPSRLTSLANLAGGAPGEAHPEQCRAADLGSPDHFGKIVR
ncbi:hypothetical protein, partial [Kroppenstedtia guangzhouensis]|uniref:hypothetical protein n=1 Tax=Kroppenstedtia guangzhouensis TaxID=1274356 RepID=UPI001E31C7FF